MILNWHEAKEQFKGGTSEEWPPALNEIFSWTSEVDKATTALSEAFRQKFVRQT